MIKDPTRPMPILNALGFKAKCCRIIPLKIGTIITCFTSILWSAAELISTEKYMARILPNKGSLFSSLCYLYMALMIGFAVASGIFLVGILATNFMAITGYLWYAVIFDFVYVSVYIATIVGCFVNDNVNRIAIVRWICAFVWQFVFWYLLVIVNSYRISIWSANVYGSYT